MPEWIFIALAGCVGGIANQHLFTGYLVLPSLSRDKRGRLGIGLGVIGDILVGGITGVAFWGLYNPSATFDDTHLHVLSVIGALLAGAGGGRVLTSLVERTTQLGAYHQAGAAFEAIFAKLDALLQEEENRAERQDNT